MNIYKFRETIKSKKVYFLFFVLVFSVLFLVNLGGQKEPIKQEKRTALVKLYKVASSQKYEKRDFPALVEASQEAVLSFEVSGVLKNLPIKEGQDVNKGELLAQLDDKEFRLLVRSRKAKYEELKKDAIRAEKLKKQKFLSSANYEKRLTQRDVAKINYQEAVRKLKNTKIKAPFSGKIAKIHIDNYQRVNPVEPILTIYDLSKIDVSIQVPEQVIEKIIADKVKDFFVIFKTRPDEKYLARYKEHSSKPNSSTKTYEVILTLDNPNQESLLPGMSANVEILFFDEQKSVSKNFLVPSYAVFSDEPNKSFVWKTQENGGAIIKSLVETKEFSNDKIEIISGLSQGEYIVSAGARFLHPDIEVKPFYGNKNNQE